MKHWGLAQEPDTKYRAVFDVSVEGAERWDGIVRNIENLRIALGERNVTVLVVVYGKALPFVQKTNAAQEAKLEMLTRVGVRFVACENTLKRMKVTRDQLFPFVQTVDAGMAELVRKQAEGWSYIKPGG